MSRTKISDRIDIELSRTYFGNGLKEEGKSSFTNTAVSGKPSRLKRIIPMVVTLAALIMIVGAAWYYFNSNHLTFDFDINIKTISQNLMKPEPKVEEKIMKDIQNIAKVDRSLLPERIMYSFEKGDEAWEIPMWALDKEDYVGTSLDRTSEMSSEGKISLKMQVEFPGKRWAAAIVEIQHFLNTESYDLVFADVYVPLECPEGLRGKLILGVSEDWRFIEMSRGIRLVPGEWTTITAKITDDSTDWKRTEFNSTVRSDVRKIAVRIEANRASYSGPIYIDNIRIERQ